MAGKGVVAAVHPWPWLVTTTVPSVPLLCPGGTVAIFASGPSLTVEDVEYCRDKVDASIAVNDSYKLAPWATALYAADESWWHVQKGALSFTGLRYSVQQHAVPWGVTVLKRTGDVGLEVDPKGLRTGKNSAYQAVNLAVHFGATRIVLLGVDMKLGPKGKRHWFGTHPRGLNDRTDFGDFIEAFQTIVEPLKQIGVSVFNCSPDSALDCFPKRPLREVLV